MTLSVLRYTAKFRDPWGAQLFAHAASWQYVAGEIEVLVLPAPRSADGECAADSVPLPRAGG